MTDTWFRVYNSIRHDRKIARLSDAEFRAWIMLLSLASEEGGAIPANPKDIAFELRVSETRARSLVQALITSGLIDEGEAEFTPHNWADRQFKSDLSRERQKRYRDRHKNRNGDGERDVTRNVTVTVQETETETETEKSSEPKGSGAVAPELFERSPKQANGTPHKPAKIDLKKQVYDRGKEVFGSSAGGIITNVLKAKENKYAKALALIEDAAEKRDPVSWINAWLWEHGPPGIEVGPLSPAL